MRKEEILILEPEDKLPGSLGYDQNGWVNGKGKLERKF